MATPTQSPTPEQSHAALQKLLNGPAALPPPGVVPNFDNPTQYEGSILYITAALTLSFATIAVVIRTYTKHSLLRSMGYEDYTSILALISFIGFAVPSIRGKTSGAGSHMWDIRLEAFFRVLYWVNIVAITYAITTIFVKLSILLQYLKIFAPSRIVDRPLFIAIHASIWSVLIFYVVDTFFLIFICSPREKIWNPLMTTGHCFDSNASYKASGVFNVLSDFAILILPMATVWKLQMSLRRRLLTMGVFATGFFACVTSILRTYYTWRVVEGQDQSWELLPMGLWTWAEIAVGIIVGCLPTLPRFFQHIGTKVHRNTHGPGTGGASSAVAVSPNANVLVSVKRSFAKYGAGRTVTDSWNDSYMPRTQHLEEYLVLDEFDAAPLQEHYPNASAGQPGQGIATAREDLEYAQGKN